MILKLILIQLIIVQVIDLSGFITSLKKAIWKWLKGKKEYQEFSLKPLDCSYCMNFWVGLTFLICAGEFTLPYLALVLTLSFLTPITKDLYILIKDALTWLLDALFRAIQ